MDIQALNLRRKAALISLLASFVVLGFKFSAYYVSRSVALYSDALETIVNIIAAGIALVVVNYAAKPKDSDHPYGHGKSEYFSATFEGGLIIFAAISIFIEGVKALYHPREITDIFSGLVLVGIATLINFLVSIYLKKIGRNYKSEALLASSVHIMSDVVTTLGVFVGLGLMILTGLGWIDGVITLVLSLHLFNEGFRIVRRSVAGLTDEIDNECLRLLADSLQKNRTTGIIDIHHLRTIRSGGFHHIDAHVVVPEFWDVFHAHEVTDGYEKKVVNDYPYDGEFAFHLDPCRKQYCSFCDVESCPIRLEPFSKLKTFSADEIIHDTQL